MRILPALLLLAACGGRLSSVEEAELAALGLERAIERSLELGLAGFNEATSANIPAQSAAGDHAGTLTVTGQVDQGASANKEMRLLAAFDAYADLATIEAPDGARVELNYTSDAPVEIDLSLRGIPDGTFTGAIDGDLELDGDLRGAITLSLSLSGDLVADGDSTRRADGATTVTGTVSNAGGGAWSVDLTL